MDPRLAASIVVAFFALGTLWADRLPAPHKKWPILGCGLVLGVLFMELARFDHGMRDTLVWVGWLGAPIVAIFCGAAWGVRKFYGWPDFGVHPPRAAFVAMAIILGVMIGSRVKTIDVDVSQQRAEAYAQRSAPHASVLSRMGWLAPPPIEHVKTAEGHPAVAFAIASNAYRIYDINDRTWRTHTGAPLRPTTSSGPE